MRRIPLSQGKTALIDDEDYNLVRRYQWHAHRVPRRRLAHQFYAAHNPPSGRKILMHNLILHASEGMVVDHINFDGLEIGGRTFGLSATPRMWRTESNPDSGRESLREGLRAP